MKLIGLARLGRDAELRQTQNSSVCNLALAYNFGQKDDGGNKPTQWVEAALWGDRANSLAQYLIKGQQFLVEVRDVHIETYDKNDGGVGVKLVGTVADIEFAGPPPQQQNDGGQQRQQGGQRSNQRQPAQAQQRQQPERSPGQRSNQQRSAPAARAPAQGASGFDDMDDDIPF